MLMTIDKREDRTCGFGLAKGPCGAKVVAKCGKVHLCREHAEWVVSNQYGLECRLIADTGSAYPATRAQFRAALAKVPD